MARRIYRAHVADYQPTISTRRTQDHPHQIETYDEINEDALYDMRSRTSTRRYLQEKPAKADKLTTPPTRNVRIYLHNQPKQQPPLAKGKRLHLPRWTVYAGTGALLIVVGWLGITPLEHMWDTYQNDQAYGRPRTFQIDAVVGHNNDSHDHPSHFIALNLNRHVSVIELPAGDPSQAHVYPTTVTLYGNGQDLTPVQLAFKDLTGDGKPEMIIEVAGQRIPYKNENGTFRPMTPQEQQQEGEEHK